MRRPCWTTAFCSRSMRASRKRSTASRKLLQCCCVWKPRMLLPSMPSSSSLAPRADAEPLGVRPRDVPEGETVARGSRSRIIRGSEREVIVLHEDDRVVAVDLFAHGVGELLVHRLVVLPIVAAERSAGCERGGRAATAPRSRSRSSSPCSSSGESQTRRRSVRLLAGRYRQPALGVRRPRGRPSRCRARPTHPSRRASPARAPSRGRWPDARRATVPSPACARGCRARDWRRSRPARRADAGSASA